jgi:uncharacterized protein YraI
MKRAGVFLILLLLIAVMVQADFGINWTGSFFNNTNFSGTPTATITGINGLNFNWPDIPNINSVPVVGIGADNFSARFTSTQTFGQGNYQFTITYDDNARVTIDGIEVFSDFTGGPVKTRSFNRDMTAGAHTIQVDFVEVSASAVLQFQWNPAGAVVTPGVGTPLAPTATAIPPLTASVTGVRGLAVRTGPYLGASFVTVARPETAYPVLGRNQSENGVTWYLITVNQKTGWASGRFLTFSTDPNSIPIQGSVFDTIDDPPETGVIAAPRAVMNLRARPSVRTPIIDSVPWGAEVPLLGRTVQGGQNFWLQVRYNGKVGWIYAPFVTIRGSVSAVPIR